MLPPPPLSRQPPVMMRLLPTTAPSNLKSRAMVFGLPSRTPTARRAQSRCAAATLALLDAPYLLRLLRLRYLWHVAR
jgi:hypothetical protein